MGEGLLMLGVLAFLCAKIWILVLIFQGSPGAALLCMIIPFLWISFVKDHWEVAKYPAMLWGLGIGDWFVVCGLRECVLAVSDDYDPKFLIMTPNV